MTLPTFIDAQLARDLLAHLASQEPDRYKALAATGFPVLDSTNPECAFMQNLIERAGGHYVDVGGTKLLEIRPCRRINGSILLSLTRN